jgi:hypothetical protein
MMMKIFYTLKYPFYKYIKFSISLFGDAHFLGHTLFFYYTFD